MEGKLNEIKIFKAIDRAIKTGNYYFTHHAKKRSRQRRKVSEFEVIKILESESKYHESKKDIFNEKFQEWNYAIRGKSIDEEDIRIIVSFEDKKMLIITVINMDEKYQ